ncbi:MAG: hypothetical protein ABJA16_12485 [Nakamurella sp.]
MDTSTAGLVRRSEAINEGWTDAELRDRVRGGDLTRIRRGGYAHGIDLGGLSPESRHRLAVTLARAGISVGAISHASAAALWDLPLVGTDLGRVHATLPKATRTGRIGPERHDHTAMLAPDEVTEIDGIPVTTPARTLVDLARSGPPSTAVVCADAALQRALVTAAALGRALDRAKGRPGVNRARRALTAADGRSESPGETLTRLALRTVAALDLQVDITDDDGRFLGRADFGVEDAALLIEFDGREKYLSYRRPGQPIEEAVLAEKRREDQLRALGYGLVRVVWKDLGTPAALADRVRRAVMRGRAAVDRGAVPRGGYQVPPRVGL